MAPTGYVLITRVTPIKWKAYNTYTYEKIITKDPLLTNCYPPGRGKYKGTHIGETAVSCVGGHKYEYISWVSGEPLVCASTECIARTTSKYLEWARTVYSESVRTENIFWMSTEHKRG